MIRLTAVFGLHRLTGVLLLPTNAIGEMVGLETLEAAIRSLTQSSGLHDAQLRSKLKDLLDDLIHCSNPRKVRLCRDACRLAYAAGLHTRCAELFLNCRTIAPETVFLNEVVVNAAAAAPNSEYLQKCLATIDNAALMEPISHAALLALRIYWQSIKCFVQLQQACKRSERYKSEARALETEEEGKEKEARLSLLAQYRNVAEMAYQMLQLPPQDPFEEWWAKSKRLVVYHSLDKGEAAVYKQHFAFWEHYFKGKPLAWFTPSCLGGMLRSCNEAARWDLADLYSLNAENYLLVKANPLDDNLLQLYLNFLSVSMQSVRGLKFMRDLRSTRPDYIPSIGVVHIAARLAGHASNEDLSVWCLQSLLDERQPIPPSSQDIFPCLVAIAKSHARSFKKLLYALQESGLVKPTDEECFHLELLYSRRSVNWKEELSHRLESHIERVGSNPEATGLSLRNAGLLLRILEENEQEVFIQYYMVYRKMFQSIQMREKARWLELALKWAFSQPHRTPETYEFLVKETQNLFGKVTDEPTIDVIDPSLAKRIRSRMNALADRAGYQREANAATPQAPSESGWRDSSMARFAKHRHLFPISRPPKVNGMARHLNTGLWQPSDALTYFAETEWKNKVQSGALQFGEK